MPASCMPAPCTPDGLLLIDKAAGLTSHAVVALGRRALATRRIGHAGTLDPAATGLLVLAVGEATKLVAHLSGEDKGYEATVCLGIGTDTLDAAGKVVAEAPLPAQLCASTVEAALQPMLGTHAQQVPMFSAVHVDGQRLHRLARAGQAVDAPWRQVTLHEAQLLAVETPFVRLRLRCSKGFYVRSFARDLAARLGTLAHLAALRRLHSGAFDLGQAISMSLLQAAAADPQQRGQLQDAMLPMRQACAGLVKVQLDREGEQHALHGRCIDACHLASGRLSDLPTNQTLALFNGQGQLIALGEREETGERLRIRRGIRLPG